MRQHLFPLGHFALTASLVLWVSPAHAQEPGGSGPEAELAGGENPAPAEEESFPLSNAPRIYVPEDFARFAPRNALDLIQQIPGFNAQGGGGGGRGLGEASGNLLINGDRLTSKSTSTFDQLSRIPVANVVRIEIVDGASLEIPGLSGRVANIITRGTGGLSGQFSFRPSFSTGPQDNNLLQGNVSVRGSQGPVNYTIALDVGGFAGGSEGFIVLTDALGVVDEYAYLNLTRFKRPSVTGSFSMDITPEVKANLNVNAGLTRFRSRSSEIRAVDNPLPTLAERFRSRNNEHSYEVSGDVEFPLGPGQMKLIALDSFESGNFVTTSLVENELRPTTGSQFGRSGESGERIGRGEYRWQLWGADWQLSGEAAFNRLDQDGSLAIYDPVAEEYIAFPFPSGSGGVREERYESILSYGRPVTDTLSLQISAGAEYSKISQTGADALSRTFQRPKGSFTLAWSPDETWDVSLEIARRVGQLNFGDFLASVNLTDDNQSAGNNQLRPQQSWESQLEATKSFGAWGSTTLRLFDQRIEDLLVIVPLPGGREARGNLESARRYGARVNGTLRLENLGIEGAELDFNVSVENSSLLDPVTGIVRRFDNNNPFDYRLNFRHDVPGTSWAYGGDISDASSAFGYRVRERSLSFDPIMSGSIFVENKDVMGLTVGMSVSNVFDGYSVSQRTVFDRPRGPDALVLFTEERRTFSGQSFRLSVSGSF